MQQTFETPFIQQRTGDVTLADVKTAINNIVVTHGWPSEIKVSLQEFIRIRTELLNGLPIFARVSAEVAPESRFTYGGCLITESPEAKEGTHVVTYKPHHSENYGQESI